MNLTITQNNRFEGSYFLENENVRESQLRGTNTLIITDKSKQLKNKIISKINSAKESIKLCSFILTDKVIVYHLEQAIAQNKVAVFILTQLDDKKINSTFLTSEELIDVQKSSENIHLGHIKTLFETGAHIRAAENLHAKFIIFDRNDVLITSANITNPSLNLNTEIGMFCAKESDIKKFDVLFDLIYQHGTQYEKFVSAGKNKQYISYTNKTIEDKWFPKTENSALKYTFDRNENSIYSEIVRIINESEKEVIIFSYSVVNVNRLTELTDAIIDALKRGVEVKLFCRAMNYRQDHLEGVSILKKLGCHIYGDAVNHSKGIINDKEGFIFTANIDGNHGLKNGFEIGYNLNKDEFADLKIFFDHKLKSAPSILVNQPTFKSILKWYSAYYRGKRIKNPLKESIYTLAFRKNEILENLLPSNLIYIVFKNDKPSMLEIANINFKIISFHGFTFEIDTTRIYKIDLKNPKYILPYFELKINSR